MFKKQIRCCKHCAETREAIKELEAEMARQVLRYEELYEVARRNLAKLASRAASGDGETPMLDPAAKARQMLIEKKLGRQ